MDDVATLSKEQLIERLVGRDTMLAAQEIELQTRDTELQTRDTELHGKNIELQTQREKLREQDIALQSKDLTIAELEQEKQEWELAYNELVQRAFGKRSERYIHDPDQLRIDFGDTDEAADASQGLADAVEELDQTIPEHKRRKRTKKRDESLPAHLPRYEVTAEVPGEIKNCPTHGERTLLPREMWDQQESLEFQRPKLRVRVTLFPKYACPNAPECGIASPERPMAISCVPLVIAMRVARFGIRNRIPTMRLIQRP